MTLRFDSDNHHARRQDNDDGDDVTTLDLILGGGLCFVIGWTSSAFLDALRILGGGGSW